MDFDRLYPHQNFFFMSDNQAVWDIETNITGNMEDDHFSEINIHGNLKMIIRAGFESHAWLGFEESCVLISCFAGHSSCYL